ncbi:hypothetical protein P3X46_001156 [Hevea brasiliensis]|uniref:Uncharacterized protein n=1 Tax=Hevea brasiliensis TaxID=3981 RepID=A0ABQ9NEV0_HEVBR|nr:uncharacterized protein LOC110640773 [Hevea brasiliensis]KAJ9189908.1 hypothetical protein P3X46_001156 [Hevea brasiliensis]
MSGPPRVRLMNIAEPENKAPRYPVKKAEKPQQQQDNESKDKKLGKVASAVLRQKSMNGSCSSDASSDSSHSRASSSSLSSRSWSSGKMAVAARRNAVVRRKQCEVKIDKDEKTGGDDDNVGVESGNVVSGNSGPLDASDSLEIKKRCGWVTPSTDPCYATFHDEEWGVQVHDDEKLFELLCLSGALSELTWPVILNRRHIFRDVFLDFNPIAVSKLNDKKIAVPGSPASSLLSELKLRSIIENARQMCKVIDEFGSFDKYIWNFVNHKPIVNQFRYSRQVPVKTPKAELISKDLVRRGFRSVGPTVIYSFMQAAGLTNDHLVSCFRFQDCINGTEVREKDESLKPKTEKKETMDPIDVGIPRAMDDYSSSK